MPDGGSQVLGKHHQTWSVPPWRREPLGDLGRGRAMEVAFQIRHLPCRTL